MATTLTKIIIGQIFVILIASGFLIFIADGAAKYNPNLPTGYNDSFVKLKNNIAEINQTLYNTNDNLQIETSGGFFGSNPITDFIGFFYNAGYKAMRTVTSLVSLTGTLVDVVIDTIFPGEFGNIARVLVAVAILVVILISIIMRSLIKGDTI